jgi:O-antigen ligase
MGGRFYFQQLVCAVFPLLFVMVRLDERSLTKLFVVQCILAATYLVSDFVFSNAPRALFFLLQFFELPGDAINFEGHARVLGMRRWQSLYIVSTAVLYLMFVRFRLRDFFGFQGVILLPLALGIFGAGLLSGHRFIVFIISTVLVLIAITQRFINFKNGVVGVIAMILGLFIAYGYADQMPLAAQRALSILPGIEVRSEARSDALATLDTRKMLRELGWRMVPQYMWVGRGFGQPGTDYSLYWDGSGLSFHLNQGRFFNGFIGLLVNTGLFGTTFMLMFLFVGSKLALGIILRVRRHNYDDMFSRVATVLASLWVANVTSFLFLHGDSEYAAKTFSLQAGLLLTCNRLLAKREEEDAPAVEPVQTYFPINPRQRSIAPAV